MKFSKKCKKNVTNPTPRLTFGLHAARYFSSSMDSSDGLSVTLNDMSQMSGKRFVIEKLPITDEVIEFTKSNKKDLLDTVFCGGEEFEIVATVPPKNIQKVTKLAKRLKIPLYKIGHVTKGKGVVFCRNDNLKTVKRCGWTHLRS